MTTVRTRVVQATSIKMKDVRNGDFFEVGGALHLKVTDGMVVDITNQDINPTPEMHSMVYPVDGLDISYTLGES